MKIILRAILWIIIGLIVGAGGFLIYSALTEYKPQKITPIYQSEKNIPLSDTSLYSILSWNVGYAGLGDNMDFFFDGGVQMCDTKERTISNLKEVGRFLKANDSIDFILLQEVDSSAQRSYYINEKEFLSKLLPGFQGYLGINYNVAFVPAPLSNPMGKVISGIVSFSRFSPQFVKRYSYPGSFEWPKKLFMLKRCFLVCIYNLSDGRQFVLINTHNTAFDDGSIRIKEIEYLQDYVFEEYKKGNYVLIGGDWNQTPDRFKPKFNLPFDTVNICYLPDNFLNDWTISFNDSIPTNRNIQTSYTEGKTMTTVIDFFISSPNIEIIAKNTIDLKFVNADHQPVMLTFKFIK